MATIEVYGFENAAGEATESFTTQDISEAREYARKNRLRVIAYEYEYADSSLVEDYTEPGEPE